MRLNNVTDAESYKLFEATIPGFSLIQLRGRASNAQKFFSLWYDISRRSLNVLVC